MKRKPGANRALAEALVNGDGSPRTRESLMRELEAVLDTVEDRGFVNGEAAARERVLREAIAIARGLEGDARVRANAFERELNALLESRRRT